MNLETILKRRHVCCLVLLSSWLVAVAPSMAKDVVDAGKDLQIKAIGTDPPYSPKMQAKFQSRHFTVLVRQEPKKKDGKCIEFCNDTDRRKGTESMLKRLSTVLGAAKEHTLLFPFPKGTQTRFDGAKKVKFNASTRTPKAVQLALANAEAAYEVLTDYYKMVPPAPNDRITIKMHTWAAGGVVNEWNSLWLGANQYHTSVIMHEINHVFQDTYILPWKPDKWAKYLTWPSVESGSMTADYMVPRSWAPVLWRYLYREDDSMLFRGKYSHLGLHYRCVHFYEYLFQRIWQEQRGRSADPARDLDDYGRLGFEYLDKWGRFAGKRLLSGSDPTERHGRDDILALRETIQDVVPNTTAATADRWLGQFHFDWWESLILDGQVAWPGFFDDRLGKAKLFIRHKNRNKAALWNYQFRREDWLGRHYLNPLAWKGFATWNKTSFDKYDKSAGKLLEGKKRRGRTQLLYTQDWVLKSRTGRGAPFEPQRPGISPFNARYAYIPAPDHGGQLTLKVTSRQGKYQGHAYARPRVQFYTRSDAPGHPLRKTWSSGQAMDDGKPYTVELNLGRDATGRVFGSGSTDEVLILIVTQDHYARSVIETSFVPAPNALSRDHARLSFSAPNYSRSRSVIQQTPGGGFGDPVAIGEFFWIGSPKDPRQLVSLGFEVTESNAPANWSFASKLRRLVVYDDVNLNDKPDQGDKIWYDGRPTVAGNQLRLDLTQHGTPIPLNLPFFAAGTSLNVAAELDGGIQQGQRIDVDLTLAAGQNTVREAGQPDRQIFVRRNETSQFAFTVACAEKQYYNLPMTVGDVPPADASGTVRIQQSASLLFRYVPCRAVGVHAKFLPLAEADTVEDFIARARERMQGLAEVMRFRETHGLPVDGVMPRRDGLPVAPALNLLGEDTLEYAWFDRDSVDCSYENVGVDSAMPLASGELVEGVGVCPDQPAYFALHDLEPGARLFLDFDGETVDAVVTTVDGRPLPALEEGGWFVDLPQGVQDLWLVLMAKDPLARSETPLMLRVEGGGESPALEGIWQPTESEESDVEDGEGEDGHGLPLGEPLGTLEDAVWVDLGTVEGELATQAWHYVTVPEGVEVMRLRCEGDGLEFEIYDDRRLLLETGGEFRLPWTSVAVEPGAGYFVRVFYPNPVGEMPLRSYRLSLENAAEPMGCEEDGLDNQGEDRAAVLEGTLTGTFCDGEANDWFRVSVPPNHVANINLDGAGVAMTWVREDDGHVELVNEDTGLFAQLEAGEWTGELVGAQSGLDYQLAMRRLPLPVEGNDLVVAEFEAPAIMDIGEVIGESLGLTLRNVGREAVDQPVGVRFYLSEDAEITPEDLRLEADVVLEEGLDGQSTHFVNLPQSLEIPFEVLPGEYYLAAWVDPEGQVVDADPSNNVRAMPVMIEDPFLGAGLGFGEKARQTLRLHWEDGQAVLRFTADDGDRFQVEFSDDLQVWEPFGAPIEGDDLETMIRLDRQGLEAYLRLSIE